MRAVRPKLAPLGNNATAYAGACFSCTHGHQLLCHRLNHNMSPHPNASWNARPVLLPVFTDQYRYRQCMMYILYRLQALRDIQGAPGTTHAAAPGAMKYVTNTLLPIPCQCLSPQSGPASSTQHVTPSSHLNPPPHSKAWLLLAPSAPPSRLNPLPRPCCPSTSALRLALLLALVLLPVHPVRRLHLPHLRFLVLGAHLNAWEGEREGVREGGEGEV